MIDIVGDVPERLRHVFKFYGIPTLAERFASLPQVITTALSVLPNDGVKKADLSTLVRNRSGLSDVLIRKPELLQAYLEAFEAALTQLEKNGQITAYGDFVVHHKRQTKHGEDVALREITDTPPESPEDVRRPEPNTGLLRRSSSHLPTIPNLSEALPTEQSQFAEVPRAPLDADAQKQLAILANEVTEDAAPTAPENKQQQTPPSLVPPDPLSHLKTLIEKELGVSVQKRLNEISLSEIVPGCSCDCTLSLQSAGTELEIKAVFPLVIDCTIELLEMAEAERLCSNLGVATAHGDRVVIIRKSVDLRRHEPAELHALSAKVLQEVVKVAKVIYDGERFRDKSRTM